MVGHFSALFLSLLCHCLRFGHEHIWPGEKRHCACVGEGHCPVCCPGEGGCQQHMPKNDWHFWRTGNWPTVLRRASEQHTKLLCSLLMAGTCAEMKHDGFNERWTLHAVHFGVSLTMRGTNLPYLTDFHISYTGGMYDPNSRQASAWNTLALTTFKRKGIFVAKSDDTAAVSVLLVGLVHISNDVKPDVGILWTFYLLD